jgi:hypothetical protein
MGPGVAAGGISATVTNTGSTAVVVNSVTVSIASITGAGPGGCSVSDYTLLNPLMTNAAGSLAPGATSSAFTGATLGFANSTTANQDGCKGATVNLAYAAA